MTASADDQTRQSVRETYAQVARAGNSAPAMPVSADAGDQEKTESAACCAPTCCSPSGSLQADDVAVGLGYAADDLTDMPEGANMGLGCGNPQAIAALQSGETVLDLGSGGGFDCFLAAKQVGESGQVIGVDMTPDMLSLARKNADKLELSNVDFRLGEIEHLPVADDTVDVILSNCVINLSPDKAQVFRDAYRVLKPGGRLAISDVVATRELPEAMKTDAAMIAGCMGGTAKVDEVRSLLEEAGFTQIEIHVKEESRQFIESWAPGTGIETYVASATIEAVKALADA